jgi:hypothetical protein
MILRSGHPIVTWSSCAVLVLYLFWGANQTGDCKDVGQGVFALGFIDLGIVQSRSLIYYYIALTDDLGDGSVATDDKRGVIAVVQPTN